MPGAVVFGIAFGALAIDAGLSGWTTLFASSSVVAGASQIAIVESLKANAPALIAIATALVINARMALYSAALTPVFAPLSWPWKALLSFLLTDQSAVVTLQHHERYRRPDRLAWFALGVAGPFVGVWVVGTAVGVLTGPVIPDAWQIGFVVPLMFIAILVPALTSAPTLTAASAAIVVTLLAKDAPYYLNVLAGALAGIAIGALVPAGPASIDRGEPIEGPA